MTKYGFRPGRTLSSNIKVRPLRTGKYGTLQETGGHGVADEDDPVRREAGIKAARKQLLDVAVPNHGRIVTAPIYLPDADTTVGAPLSVSCIPNVEGAKVHGARFIVATTSPRDGTARQETMHAN